GANWTKLNERASALPGSKKSTWFWRIGLHVLPGAHSIRFRVGFDFSEHNGKRGKVKRFTFPRSLFPKKSLRFVAAFFPFLLLRIHFSRTRCGWWRTLSMRCRRFSSRLRVGWAIVSLRRRWQSHLFQLR